VADAADAPGQGEIVNAMLGRACSERNWSLRRTLQFSKRIIRSVVAADLFVTSQHRPKKEIQFMQEQNFVHFINEILEEVHFRSFGILTFLNSRFRPPSAVTKYWEEIWEGDPERRHWYKTRSTEWECVEQWMRDVDVHNYLCVHEPRGGDESRFHILVDLFGAFDDTARYRWKEISGGWASERQLDDRIGRLIGHMVMRKGYPLTVRCGRFSGHYTQEDFRPWWVESY
jgi:hypothetical protein